MQKVIKSNSGLHAPRAIFSCNLRIATRHIAAGHIWVKPQTARKPYSVTTSDKPRAILSYNLRQATRHIAAGHIRL